MNRKLLTLLLAIFVTVVTAQTYRADALDGRVMFKLKDNVQIDGEHVKPLADASITNKVVNLQDFPELNQILSKYNIIKTQRPSYYTGIPSLVRIFDIQFSDFEDIDNIIRDLEKSDIIEYASKMPIYKIDFVPNDTYYSGSDKWYLDLVNAEGAWDYSQGSSSIKVAIVDNAVFTDHLDLTTFAKYDVADDDDDPTPPEDAYSDFKWSHGTHCAGLATADINNNRGIASLGAGVELIGIKCTPDDGTSGNVYYSYAGVQKAIAFGAKVVSMSFGAPSPDPNMQTLINAYPNVVFLAAAGNDGTTDENYPGGLDNVICVGSVDADDSRSSFSNYNSITGTWVDICSPGGYSNSGLISTVYTTDADGYYYMGGTSMATPFAAGLAGLMLSLNPTMSPVDIENCMISSGASNSGHMGPRIDAAAAMACVQSTLNGDPTADFWADHTTITVGGSVNFSDLSGDGGIAITSWEWTFNGGSITSYSGQTPPAVTYNTIGTYTVELTVTNSQNSDTETKTAYINVTEEPVGSWIEQASGFTAASRGIKDICIVSNDIVWAIAYDGSNGGANVQEFTKTTNGGTTWTPETIDVGNTALGIAMIYALDENTAWVPVFPQSAGQYGGIWKTTDGGASWTKQTSASFSDGSSFANIVHFWDANNGVCGGDPINGEFEIYTTTDGGANWTLVSGANIPDPLSGEYGYTSQIEVVGDNVWFTTNKGRVYHSTDKGYNWTVSTTPISDFGSSPTVSFKDANNGIFVSSTGNIYKSTDAGANWTQATTTGTIFPNGICWVEGTDRVYSTGSASGSSGSSYSDNGGIDWIGIDDVQHLDVEFISLNVGWSGDFNTDATTKGMWKWQPVSTLEANFMGVPTQVCAGSDVSFQDLTSGGTPTSWDWSFAGGTPSTSTDQNPTITYDTPGTYTVSLTVDDGNGPNTVVFSSYINVIDVPDQPSTITGNTTPTVGANETYSVTAVPGVTYTWTLPSGWTGSSTTYSIDVVVGSDSGDITCTPNNSCGDGTPRTLNISVTGIEDAAYNMFNIYPNPAKDYLNIEFESNDTEISYALIDINGKIIISNIIKDTQNTAKLNISSLDKGIYTLRLIINNEVINKKIVIE